MAVEMKLSWMELQQAAVVGVARRILSMKSGLNKNKHATTSDWATDIDGASAELVVAKFTSQYWPATVNDFKNSPDVGSLHVRSTRHTNGHLIVRNNDPNDGTYVLVVTDPPKFVIVGSITGHVAKQDIWIREGFGGCTSWWVPQSSLTPVEMWNTTDDRQ